MHIAHRVRQSLELLLRRFGYLGVGVARGGDGECACEIEILFAGGIPHVYTFSSLPDHGPGAVLRNVRDIATLVLLQEF